MRAWDDSPEDKLLQEDWWAVHRVSVGGPGVGGQMLVEGPEVPGTPEATPGAPSW